MPKRHGALFERMFTLDALYQAYLKARQRKRKKFTIAAFERNLGANLQRLHDELHSGTYQPRPYKTFEVFEPKRRVIYAPHFRDVVVQHAMYAVLYPIMDASFCYESWGCRVGKGTHGAADRAQRCLRASRPDSYILQLDVRKFFYRIDRNILASLWERKIKDQRVLTLLGTFASYPDATGIPIGNLLSQLGALVYLNPLDHFIKRELGIARYVRYVDDFILFDLDREQAHQLRERIETWLAERLRLELSKWSVHQVKRGINFVGFRTWRKTRFVRKHALDNFSRALRRGKTASVVSALGHARHTASFAHMVRRCAEVPAVLAEPTARCPTFFWSHPCPCLSTPPIRPQAQTAPACAFAQASPALPSWLSLMAMPTSMCQTALLSRSSLPKSTGKPSPRTLHCWPASKPRAALCS